MLCAHPVCPGMDQQSPLREEQLKKTQDNVGFASFGLTSLERSCNKIHLPGTSLHPPVSPWGPLCPPIRREGSCCWFRGRLGTWGQPGTVFAALPLPRHRSQLRLRCPCGRRAPTSLTPSSRVAPPGPLASRGTGCPAATGETSSLAGGRRCPLGHAGSLV